MAAESIYSALMEIKDVIGNGGSSGGQGSGSGSGCECETVIPVFDMLVDNDDVSISCDYTPREFKTLHLAGKINMCVINVTETGSGYTTTYTTSLIGYDIRSDLVEEEGDEGRIYIYLMFTNGDSVFTNPIIVSSIKSNIWRGMDDK